MQKTYLIHHGIKGQRWGVRRYQNEDGTLTKEGLDRYKEELSNATDKEKYKHFKSDIKFLSAKNKKGTAQRYIETDKSKKYDELGNKAEQEFTKKQIKALSKIEPDNKVLQEIGEKDTYTVEEQNRINRQAMRLRYKMTDAEENDITESAEKSLEYYKKRNQNAIDIYAEISNAYGEEKASKFAKRHNIETQAKAVAIMLGSVGGLSIAGILASQLK